LVVNLYTNIGLAIATYSREAMTGEFHNEPSILSKRDDSTQFYM